MRHLRYPLLLLFIFSLITPLTHASTSYAVVVHVKSLEANDHNIQINTESPASSQSLWQVLTDYDHHSQYVPHLRSTRIMKRDGPSIVIEQMGAVRVLFWTYTMRAVFQVEEKAPGAIFFHVIDGDFTKLEGQWHLHPMDSGTTQVDVTFLCKPRAHVPAWAVRFVAKHYLVSMVKALVTRAEQSPLSPEKRR